MTGVLILVAILLLLANGFFVGAEVAITAAAGRRAEVERQAAEGRRSAKLAAASMRELSFMLTGAQLGITMASLGLGFVRFYANSMRSVLWALNATANLVIRAIGISPREELTHAYTHDQIGSMLGELRRLGAISEPQQKLADRALRFATRSVEDVMVPRSAIHSVLSGMTVREIERAAVDTGYSRFPVQGTAPDTIIGFVHVKDLLALDQEHSDRPLPVTAIRPLHVAPLTALVGELLLTMRRARAHMALVVDEHGSPAGIVTLEDLVEEVVGEIRDAHDTPIDELHRLGDNRFVASGLLRLDRLTDATGCEIDDGDYTTVGGFVMHRLGSVPKPGASIEHQGWLFRVRRMSGPRVETIDVIRSTNTSTTNATEPTEKANQASP